MEYSSKVVGILALVALSTASIGDNSLDNGDPVVLVSPVLVPPSDSKIRFIDRSGQIPILVLLGQGNLPEYFGQPEVKSSEENPQPSETQKVEGEKQPASLIEMLHREKRHSKRNGGGGSGCYNCGRPQPVYNSGCSSCGGGGGGGYSQAVAIAKASSYGKK